jgi:hypothetical protein
MVFALLGISHVGKFLKRTHAAILQSKSIEVTLNLATEPDWTLYERVKKALEAAPQTLKIELVGLGHVQPDVVLAIYDLLLNRDSCISLHVAVKTSLYDGSLLMVLPAQKISVRSNSWFQLDSMEKLDSNDWLERGENWMYNRRYSSNEPAVVTDYRSVYTILNQYLPLKEIADRRLPLESTLKEYGLLHSEAEELAFQKIFYS